MQHNPFDDLKAGRSLFWSNPHVLGSTDDDPLGREVETASDRLRRSAALLARLFPAAITECASPLRSPLLLATPLARRFGLDPASADRWWIKADHLLPVAGSVKARGGFHEVIAYAERIAIQHGLISPDDDLVRLSEPDARALFAKYSVVVGSTGNLGMGIGLIASVLGFGTTVHMSADAKGWKKNRLREHGVSVIEHRGDYALAVAEGRIAADGDPTAHFVDDERSIDLFAGYAAAADELIQQLHERGIAIDEEHPLFVYIPCGVGGAPGGIAYGLKRRLGAAAHCIFAEPVQSPCMLVQLASGGVNPVSVYDLGLSNRTEADGLAVGQASLLVAPLMETRLDAVYTLTDDQLFGLVAADHESLDLGVEPSAAAALAGPLMLGSPAGKLHVERLGLAPYMPNATHILWTTGGSLIPAADRAAILERARQAAAFVVAPSGATHLPRVEAQ